MATPAPNGFIARGGPWVVLQNALTLSLLAAGPLGHAYPWSAPVRALGVPFLLVSAWLGIGGAVAMGRQLSPYPCSDRASRIVQTGVYGLVRHPLYGCLMTFGFGWAFVWSSPMAVALAFAHALALLGKARVEEEWMRQRFPDYPAYAARVRRFIPWIW
jgi:protein-S-isoprenylcysteine O-methyltransferase Ste14